MIPAIIAVCSTLMLALIGGIFKLILNHLKHHEDRLEPTVHTMNGKMDAILNHFLIPYEDK